MKSENSFIFNIICDSKWRCEENTKNDGKSTEKIYDRNQSLLVTTFNLT